MATIQAKPQLPKNLVIEGRFNPRYTGWYISVIMTVLIATPMSFFMALIVFGTEHLAANFGKNMLAATPIAFIAAHFGYNYIVGPLVEKTIKYNFKQEIRTKSLIQMMSSKRFWFFGILVDLLLCVFIAPPVAFVKVPWLAMNFAPGWFQAWMIATAQSYALAAGIAFIAIILTIAIIKKITWKPPKPPQ